MYSFEVYLWPLCVMLSGIAVLFWVLDNKYEIKKSGRYILGWTIYMIFSLFMFWFLSNGFNIKKMPDQAVVLFFFFLAPLVLRFLNLICLIINFGRGEKSKPVKAIEPEKIIIEKQ